MAAARLLVHVSCGAIVLKDSRDIITRLRQDGFELVSIKGSHHKFRHSISRRMAIVTHPKRDIPVGTVLSVYKQAGWQKD